MSDADSDPCDLTDDESRAVGDMEQTLRDVMDDHDRRLTALEDMIGDRDIVLAQDAE